MQCILSQKWSPAHRGPIPRMHGMALRRSQRVIMSGLLNWILHMERPTAIITQEAIFSPSSCSVWVSECGAVIALSQLSHCQLCVCCWEKGTQLPLGYDTRFNLKRWASVGQCHPLWYCISSLCISRAILFVAPIGAACIIMKKKWSSLGRWSVAVLRWMKSSPGTLRSVFSYHVFLSPLLLCGNWSKLPMHQIILVLTWFSNLQAHEV